MSTLETVAAESVQTQSASYTDVSRVSAVTRGELDTPRDALLVIQYGTVATVLNSGDRLDIPGLVECGGSDESVDPIDGDTRHWYGEIRSETSRPGRVTLR